jgi:hypothetical protein
MCRARRVSGNTSLAYVAACSSVKLLLLRKMAPAQSAITYPSTPPIAAMRPSVSSMYDCARGRSV